MVKSYKELIGYQKAYQLALAVYELTGAFPPAELGRRRTRFVSHIYRLLDEQRIDVVIATQDQQDSREVVASAKREGIQVAQV